MKSLILLLHMPKNNKDFFHRCNHLFSKHRHDYEHCEIWHQQGVGNPQLIENFSFEEEG
jgi:hypothetical protein